MPQVTVTVDGKPIRAEGKTARVILWVLRQTAIINAEDATGVIELNIGTQDDAFKPKYKLCPAIE